MRMMKWHCLSGDHQLVVDEANREADEEADKEADEEGGHPFLPHLPLLLPPSMSRMHFRKRLQGDMFSSFILIHLRIGTFLYNSSEKKLDA